MCQNEWVSRDISTFVLFSFFLPPCHPFLLLEGNHVEGYYKQMMKSFTPNTRSYTPLLLNITLTFLDP